MIEIAQALNELELRPDLKARIVHAAIARHLYRKRGDDSPELDQSLHRAIEGLVKQDEFGDSAAEISMEQVW